MRTDLVVRSAVLALSLFGVCCGGNYTSPGPMARGGPTAEEQARNIHGLQPAKRTRPVVAVLADNAGTETTDFLIPYGVLAESNLADVIAVAPEAGPIKLMPALTVQPQQTTESFDANYPDGADYVIVPAMHRTDSPRVLEWIRAQAATRATIIGICSGAMVIAETGLLDNHSATTHWFDINALERHNPTVTRVDDRRYVVDRGIVTTTGVTASVPISLAIVEAIGGRPAAEALAHRLGASDWSAAHDSSAFRLRWRLVMLGIRNWLAFWSHERIGIKVKEGVDEIALAFSADAYSRTFKSKAFTVAGVPGHVRTKRGLHLLPDSVDDTADIHHFIEVSQDTRPLRALDAVLDDIGFRYGERVAEFVALQLEYPAREWDQKRGAARATP